MEGRELTSLQSCRTLGACLCLGQPPAAGKSNSVQLPGAGTGSRAGEERLTPGSQPGWGGRWAGREPCSLGGSCFDLALSTAKKCLSVSFLVWLTASKTSKQGIHWGSCQSGLSALTNALHLPFDLFNAVWLFCKMPPLPCSSPQPLWKEPSCETSGRTEWLSGA